MALARLPAKQEVTSHWSTGCHSGKVSLTGSKWVHWASIRLLLLPKDRITTKWQGKNDSGIPSYSKAVALLITYQISSSEDAVKNIRLLTGEEGLLGVLGGRVLVGKVPWGHQASGGRQDTKDPGNERISKHLSGS